MASTQLILIRSKDVCAGGVCKLWLYGYELSSPLGHQSPIIQSKYARKDSSYPSVSLTVWCWPQLDHSGGTAILRLNALAV